MSRVVFTDPKTNTTYTWANNPPWDGIQPQTKQRQIERTSNTGNVGVTKQQGDDGSYILDWKVHVFTEAHHEAMWAWYAKCKLQTIYLTDWLGNEYEGQIVMLNEQEVGALAGPGDTRENVGYWVMEMQFEVYRFISGTMAIAGVTP